MIHRPVPPLSRQLIRASAAATGFALGCALFGRPALAIVAAGIAAALALTVLRNLARLGDR